VWNGLRILVITSLVSALFITSGCATSRRNKYAMQRTYTSGTSAFVSDSPGDYRKTEEQRVKAAFGRQ